MIYKWFCILAAALMSVSMAAFAEEAAPKEAAQAAEEDPLLEAEIKYVEALVMFGYPDIAEPVIAETKKKWPESETRFFALEVRGLLALGKFEEAEKKIAALPDRTGAKFWAARLEVANNYFSRGQKEACMAIYEEFFKKYPTPPKELRKFHIDASYAYGQLLAGAGNYKRAAEVYENLLNTLKPTESTWCDLAIETLEIYLRLIEADTSEKSKDRAGYISAADKLANKLLYRQDLPVVFGRAVSMKAHVSQLKGDIDGATTIIDDYIGDLEDIHEQIVQADPEGKFGLLRASPLPECRYLQAKMRWDEAQALKKGKVDPKKAKKDPKKPAAKGSVDDRVKDLMFGPRGSDGKRIGEKGAYNIALSIFLNYETSVWAPAAGEMADEIKAFAEKQYGAKIRTSITPEQIEKVRAAQFKAANESFAAGEYEKAIEAYLAVLAKFPEYPQSVQAVENVANAYLDLILEQKDDAAKVADYRMDADAVEGYISERFSGNPNRSIVIAAGDATIRLAAKEQERKQYTRADWLYEQFFTNYRAHPNAAVMAASRANEAQKAEKWADAAKTWGLVAKYYTNSIYYAGSLAQLSVCSGKMGDPTNQIAYLKQYLGVETVKVRQLQAQAQLAQLYQRDGVRILGEIAEQGTNLTAEVAAAQEKLASAQIIRAIQQFKNFAGQTEKAINDPGTPKADVESYRKLREAALFLVGDCWGRLTRPEDKVKAFRGYAAEGYEAYLAAYPEGRYSTNAYVRLGTIYTALGNTEKAKDALTRLSEKFPESDEAKNAKPRLARSLIEMGMKKEGAEIYAEMLRTDGKYTAGQYLNAGEALIEGQSWDLANQAFEKAARLAGTNMPTTVARARLGQAKSAYRQGSLAEARESLDLFLQDPKMSKMAIAADANFLLVEVASAQGRTEKDQAMRTKYFNAAVGAVKKVRTYWGRKPQWQQDQIDLMSGDVLVRRMHAEEAMGLKEEAAETCGRAASTFQVFIQAHGVDDQHPADKMSAGELENLERAYATLVPLLSKMGAEQADRVVDFGQQYLDLFPNGKARTEIGNCMNKAKADMPAAPAVPAAPQAQVEVGG